MRVIWWRRVKTNFILFSSKTIKPAVRLQSLFQSFSTASIKILSSISRNILLLCPGSDNFKMPVKADDGNYQKKTTNWSDGLSKNSLFFAVIFFSILRMTKNSPVLHRKSKPKTCFNINAGQTTSSSKNAAYVM